ncbi:next to BRCA1 gene 1 protein isoform X2 [Periophthalmus magnuspinnatus]|uniref:next to BRCA1 gene 1 protein isoform X2 n=1 Tax=Periophthalmus magnuspinnatus TaxID=409849 RepID=UPI00243739BA|nr:next to BRCA1 gene 1 protein isoform X2 [Periophthalmus magnuspinnatus]
MELYISLKVNFRGNSKSFLLSGSETKSWESLEAMMKRSFGLCSLQLTYYDEENEEEMINNQVDYEEALKSAAKQGNRLQINVYEVRGQQTRVSTTKASATEPKRGFRPPQPCPALAQVVSRKVQAAVPDQGMMILKEMKGTKEEDKTPPAWFTSYMEKFKDQVVREAVEKICREFSGQCCIHKPVGGATASGAAASGRGETAGATEPPMVPEVSSSALPGVPTSATPSCSACRGQTTGGGYQCSVCTACTLCEPCSFSHDPSHNLVRARTPLSIPEHGSPAPDHSRFYRRGDRSFRKAEKQRLKAEKRLLKAEVKEIRKQLRMERRGIQWSSTHREGCSSPVLLQPRATQHTSPERPKRPCPLAVPAMTATFLDENLPDGTRLRPGTKFIKYWKMRNTGSVGWTQDTKLKFMWGNLAVGSGERWREVSVPFLQPGQVGVVSVALCAPPVEGSYTSHWRLAHAGEQFGPRVWCSIVVDPLAPAPVIADGILVSPCVTPQGRNPIHKEKLCAAAAPPLLSVDQEEYCIPSVELLTAQDLLSFELLDINIVQELESVPNSSPADCPLQDKGGPTLGLIQEEAEVINSIMDMTHTAASGATAPGPSGVPAQEEGQEDLSSSQFVCETVIRSMPLEKVPESRPVPEPRPGATEAPGVKDSVPLSSAVKSLKSPGTSPSKLPAPLQALSVVPALAVGPCSAQGPRSVPTHLQAPATAADEGGQCTMKSLCLGPTQGHQHTDRTRSRSSSTSSEDYIIVLPDCFDTSRPLGDSMYSSALSQPGDVPARTPTDPSADASADSSADQFADPSADPPGPSAVSGAPDRGPSPSSANDMLCTSQTLDQEPLTPEVVAPPMAPRSDSPDATEPQSAAADRDIEDCDAPDTPQVSNSGQDQVDGREPSIEPEQEPSEDPSDTGLTSGLVKGALSVAASAYKALFTGQGPPQPPVDASSQDAMLSVLQEMGFRDRVLNQRLLLKHTYNLLDVVNELVHLTEAEY